VSYIIIGAAHLGDYVFYDGTYGPTTAGKTVVGICFYINPADANDRRMVALSNLENSFPAQDYRYLHQSEFRHLFLLLNIDSRIKYHRNYL
jgi:hypothetical protein